MISQAVKIRILVPTAAAGVADSLARIIAGKNTPGSINVPVHIGGVVVCPGDIVVGDDDGVVVIPRAMAKVALEKARLRDLKERETGGVTAAELPLDPSGAALSLDKLLAGRVIEHHELQSWDPDGDAGKP